MAEYIDKGTAIAKLTALEVTEPNATMADAKRVLADMPTADVAPVVHGQWNNMDGYKTRKVCSECDWDVPEYGKFYSYCPNCGAKMNEKEAVYD